MKADIQGALNQINKSYRAFVHNGKPMTKIQVKTVLEYGLKKGYKHTGEFTQEEIDEIISKL
jgi:ribulose bisphosphate carboxylase small subunit